MRLTEKCTYCGKPAESTGKTTSLPVNGELKTFVVLKCGHMILESKPLDAKLDVVTSIDGKKRMYDYQEAGVEFIQKTGYSALIGDAMGLGKTIQAIMALANAPDELLPAVVLVKSATVYQWAKEIKEWLDNSTLSVIPITNSQVPVFPGFKIYVVSMDTFSRISSRFLTLGIKTIIADECHSFKNGDSKRSRALVKFITDAKIKHKILLSGTPIKNRAVEYFTALNIIAPHHFRSLETFKRDWLIQNDKGQYYRISPWKLDAFKKMTSAYILRREKHEVQKNLPKLVLNYEQFIVEDDDIKNAYNRELDLYQNFLNGNGKIDAASMLAWLQKFRRLVGKAKVQYAIDFTNQFFDSIEDEKIAIGVHHRDVVDLLSYTLTDYDPVKITGSDTPERKERVKDMMNEDPSKRLLLISELSGGVGLNLQGVNNVLMLERQWNAADEDQFVSRFHRDGQTRPVYLTVPLAYGTIDHFFHEMVEEKRKICGETLGSWDASSDEGFLKELSERMVANRL